MSINSNLSLPAVPHFNISDVPPERDTFSYNLLVILGSVSVVAIVAFFILYAWCDVFLDYLFQSSDSSSDNTTTVDSSDSSSDSSSDDDGSSSLGLNRMFNREDEHSDDVRELSNDPPPKYSSVVIEDPKVDLDQTTRPKFGFLWRDDDTSEEGGSRSPPSYADYVASLQRSV